MVNEISGKKFHKIAGPLQVALEATFPSGEKLKYEKSFAFLDLVFSSREGLVQRVYHPASTAGSPGNGGLKIVFFPWIQNEAQFHRLVFNGRGPGIEDVIFARFPRVVNGKVIDDKVFGFKPKKAPYINLDFFGKRTEEFIPLFVRVDSQLLKIEAEIQEEEVSLNIIQVTMEEAPPHLGATCVTA